MIRVQLLRRELVLLQKFKFDLKGGRDGAAYNDFQAF